MIIELNGFLPFFLAVGISYISASNLLTGLPLLRLALATLMTVAFSSIAVGVSIQAEQSVHREITLVLSITTALVTAISNLNHLRPRFLFSIFFQSASVIGLLFLAEWAVRQLRFTSVAFGDIFTLIGISEIFKQAAGLEPLGTSLALKRGAGFPSVQALSPEQELSHGFMVIAFLAWILLTLHLFRALMKNQRVFTLALGFLIFVGIALSTEAVLRNSLFLSSHLLTALAIGLLISFFIEGKSTWHSVAAMIFAISAAIFMRADTALILLLPLSALILGNKITSPAKKATVFGVSYLSLPFWLWSFQVDISSAVTLGSTLFAIAGALISFYIPENYQWDVYSYFRNRMIAILVVAVGLSLLTSVSLSSFEALYQNYVMTEGLWGYSVLVIGGLSVSLWLLRRKVDSVQNDVLALTVGFLGMMVLAKFGDGVFFSGALEFARIGWGDSINRLLIYVFAPLSAVLFARVFDPEAKLDQLNSRPLTKSNLS